MIHRSDSSTIPKINIIALFTQFGFRQRKEPLFRHLGFLLQFFCFFILKTSLFPSQYNSLIHQTSNNIMIFCLNPFFLGFLNLVILVPFVLFVAWNIIQIWNNSRHSLQSGFAYTQRFKILTINSMFALNILAVPCMTTNIRWLYNIIAEPQIHLNIGLLIFSGVSFCFACLLVFVDSYGMLLGLTTIPIIICCIGQKWNLTVVSTFALLLLLSQLQYNRNFASSTFKLATIFKFLLVFIFVLDVFTSEISNAFFLLYIIIITLIPIISPEPEYFSNNIDLNNFLIKVLDEMKGKKEIKTMMEYKVVKEIMKYQQTQQGAQESHLKYRAPFKLTNPLSYQNLSNFFKVKIVEDMERHKNESIYKVQNFLFEVKHNNMPHDVLIEITKFSQQISKTMEIAPKIILHEVQLEINSIFRKKNEKFNMNKIFDICSTIDRTNYHIDEILNRMIKFWKQLKAYELNFHDAFETLRQIQKRETNVKNAITYLEQYESLRTQTKLYKHALKVFDFNYNIEQYLKRQTLANTLLSTYYIVLSQYKIVDISNQMLLELKKKKKQVLGRSLEALIPEEIVSFIEGRFIESLKQKAVEKRVIPFLDIRGNLLPQQVELETTFSIQLGVKQIVHFLRSDDIKEQPIFLYQLSTDRILHTNKLFNKYIKNKDRKISSSNMGFDLFGSSLTLTLIRSNLKVNETFSCALLQQKQIHHKQYLHIQILEIFQNQFSECFLLAIQNNEEITSLYESTIFSMNTFMKKKSKQDDKYYLQSTNKSLEDLQEKTVICPISNSYQATIDESLTKIKIKCRMTYFKCVSILMILLLCISLAYFVFLWLSMNNLSTRVSSSFEREFNKERVIESSYELFFMYYEYYQIRNYPEQILKMQNYNITQLNSEYQKLVNSNIRKISQLAVKNYTINSKKYILKNIYFNETKTTSALSMIDFLSDIKQALYSNKPHFSVRNQHNIDIILSAYECSDLQYMQGEIDRIILIATGTCIVSIMLALILKALTFKLKQLSRNIFQLYETIPEEVINKQIQQYQELKTVTQYSDPWIDKTQEDQNKKQQVGINELVKQKKRIKQKSIMSFLMSNNMVIFFCLGQTIFIFWMQQLLIGYNTDMKVVLAKQQFLLNTHINITRPAQKFYQRAMEQILPTDQRYSTSFNPSQTLYTDHGQYTLPSQFDQYQTLENSMLQTNLCHYDYFNNNLMYAGLKCSDILDGSMKMTYPQLFAQYKQLIRNYTGVGISKLGTTYRFGAQYPVFLEIGYVRRILNLIFQSLKTQFYAKVPDFVENEKNRVVSVLFNSIFFLPIFIVLMVMEFNRLRKEADATIRAFKMIPKQYLLKMNVTRYIKNENILQKMESF